MRWSALLQSLALRPGGPPSFCLTNVGPPQPNETDALQQVGWKLTQFAHTIRVDFQYQASSAPRSLTWSRSCCNRTVRTRMTNPR
jgi:hypothetical protein